MAEQEIKRVNFFNGQFLKQEEFLDLDKYHLHMRRRWTYVMFDKSGVVQATASDLTIEGPNEHPELSPKSIRVKAGMAIGKREDLAESREIVLLADQTINLSAQGVLTGEKAIITIHRQEVEESPSSDGGVTGNTRILEQAIITVHRNNITDSRPDKSKSEPFVTLGAFTFDDMKPVSPSPRQTAFLNVSLLSTLQIILSSGTVVQGGQITATVSSSMNLSAVNASNFALPTDVTLGAIVSPNATTLTVPLNIGSSATVGTVTVTITVSGITAQASFTVQALVLPPTISKVFGPSLENVVKKSQPMTIEGTNFFPAISVQFFNGTIVNNFTLATNSKIVFNVPSAAATGKITVVAQGGSVQSVGDITVQI